jgi:hypothetical protein
MLDVLSRSEFPEVWRRGTFSSSLSAGSSQVIEAGVLFGDTIEVTANLVKVF